MAMFDTTQVPIQEPMYINGQLSQVWLMFFLRLSQVASVDDQVDLTEITQMVHQLPAQATQGQILMDVSALKDMQPLIQQQTIQSEIPQPLQAVFLHPDQYVPLVSANINQQVLMPTINLPSVEVIRDSI